MEAGRVAEKERGESRDWAGPSGQETFEMSKM